MTIRVAHLYYDLMNLYGEIGNLKVIEYQLKKQKINVIIDKLSLNDKIEFEKYDLIYIGSGTKKSTLLVLEDLKKYKQQVKEYIENNKFMLVTGNSINVFSKKIGDTEALNIFDFNISYSNARLVGDVILDNIIGFQNRDTLIENNNNPIFNNSEIGIHYKNFYGTYIIGPLLIRNPNFSQKFIKNLIISKKNDFKFRKFDFEIDKKASKSYVEIYYN
jgi:CobQ-like glutamine amidotransferase family enzyme